MSPLGETTVNTYFPLDHLHTSPTGANVVAEAFVRGVLCSSSTLKNFVNSAGEAVPSKFEPVYDNHGRNSLAFTDGCL